DPSGGAGIEADLKTFSAHGIYGMSCITALTAQNTTGVFGVKATPHEFLEKMLSACIIDIFPDAVKIGMAVSSDIMAVIAKTITKYNLKNIVLDPVMVASSGAVLLDPDAIEALVTKLFPLASIITPNILEAEKLAGLKISTEEDIKKAAIILSKTTSAAILIKGGHSLKEEDTANDLLFEGGEMHWLSSPRVKNPNNHGTGCTLSSAIACNLAKGHKMRVAVQNAKNYITKALLSNLNLGAGSGPLNHFVK
ncbi:MAG: bifunctional hydroxymethylpyrimidine kinase/phosphomethylpyrimidine kinase, partial [Firmicutes bacterium]|nr:bifunctional hydroxymethylpyrimidine kinase/phosphomethylpyrimidine kinase [Bacillota bacterium]